MTEPILTVRQARFVRGRNEILRGIDLDLAQGAVTALLGPSGSGKTTLLRIIAGLERLDGGEILSGSEPLDGRKNWVQPNRRGFGLVFQDGALFPHMTALKNVAYGLSHLKGDKRRAEARVWLDRVDLGHRADAYPHELSGGEQQRIALARALAPQPRLILLDEPFSSLDRALRAELRQRTAQLLAASGISALIVTHDAEEAMELASTIALMQDGRILETGTPDALYTTPGSRAAARLLGAVNAWSGPVRSGTIETPIGRFDAPGFAEGETAHVLVRPEHVGIGAGEDFTIVRRVFGGRTGELHAIANDGSEWHASVPHGLLPENERASLSASPSNVVVVKE